MSSAHLPYSYFCPASGCYKRGGRKDEIKEHIKSSHRDLVAGLEPRPIYNTGLILDYIFKDGAPVERAEKYALDFVYETALREGLVGVWKDRCGRKEKLGQCRCDEQA
jgi:hypothetical protein